MEMLSSEKNKPMGHFEEYLYWRKEQIGKRTYWHCIFYKLGVDGKVESKCPGIFKPLYMFFGFHGIFEQEELQLSMAWSTFDGMVTLDDALGLDDVEVLANQFGIKLNKEQLGFLEPTVWLNGETVNFYHQMIVQQNKSDLNLPPVFSFDSLFYTQLQEKGPNAVLNWAKDVEIFAFELLLIPIYSSGHWSLVGVNTVKERLVYYDSLLGDGTEHTSLIKEFLQEYAIENGYEALDPGNWIGFCPKGIPRQTNTFDCGVFICQYSKCLSRGEQFHFTEAQMDGIRKEMSEEILGGTLF